MSGLTKALHYLAIEPAQKRSPALSLFRMTQILHERASGGCDHILLRLGAVLKPKAKLPPSRLTDDSAVAATLDALNRRGWDILPWRLGAQDIAEIRRFAFSTPAYGADPFDRVMIDEAHIPHDRGRYEWRISELIRQPAVQRLVADSALHRIAQGYLGCRPILTSVTLWLDPVYNGQFEAHIYHYDNDGPRFLKFFIYLNDVDVDIRRPHLHPGQSRSHQAKIIPAVAALRPRRSVAPLRRGERDRLRRARRHDPGGGHRRIPQGHGFEERLPVVDAAAIRRVRHPARRGIQLWHR